ncbi:MAG TPA: hypothetical protein VNN19_08005 [bacterium]|nr:hypothetical protein [bacterium]
MSARAMSCREARDVVLEALTGAVAPDVRLRLNRHLEACARCRLEAGIYEDVAGALRSSPEPRLPPGHWEEFMARLDRALQADRRRPAARISRWLRVPRHAWSVAVATAALIAALVFSLPEAPSPPPAAQPSGPVGLPVLHPYVTESIIRAQPAMGTSLAVWKAGFGATDTPFDPPGGE